VEYGGSLGLAKLMKLLYTALTCGTPNPLPITVAPKPISRWFVELSVMLLCNCVELIAVIRLLID
jgi:hypothetical protein